MATLSKGCSTVIPAVFLWLLLIIPARSVEYTVDGWKLGANIESGSLQAYSCKPAPAFEQLTSCTRTQPTNLGSLAGALMHNENGVIVFLKVKVAPVQMTKNDIQKEIVELSGELGGSQPVSVNWVDAIADRPASVIARWGQIKLERAKIPTPPTRWNSRPWTFSWTVLATRNARHNRLKSIACWRDRLHLLRQL